MVVRPDGRAACVALERDRTLDADEPGPEADLTLSALLLALAECEGSRLSIEAVLAHFGRRAFGAALFVFAAPNLLPLPPGSSTVLGLPLLIIAPQLMFGAKTPWLPRSVGCRTLDLSVLRAFCRRAAPWVARVERLTTRRLPFMFAGPGVIAIGLVCTLLAAVLLLPIPLGNLLPATAIAILALSLTQRDGVLAVAGHLAAGASVAVLVLGGRVVVAAAMRLGAMTGLW
jgi:hypothetical protein